MSREKLKRKQAVIERQEEELDGKEQALKLAGTASRQTSQSADKLRQEMMACRVGTFSESCIAIFLAEMSVIFSRSADNCLARQDENKALRSKLEECTKQLQSNGQMIRWLNDQVYTAPSPWPNTEICGLHTRALGMCHGQC